MINRLLIVATTLLMIISVLTYQTITNTNNSSKNSPSQVNNPSSPSPSPPPSPIIDQTTDLSTLNQNQTSEDFSQDYQKLKDEVGNF